MLLFFHDIIIGGIAETWSQVQNPFHSSGASWFVGRKTFRMILFPAAMQIHITVSGHTHVVVWWSVVKFVLEVQMKANEFTPNCISISQILRSVECFIGCCFWKPVWVLRARNAWCVCVCLSTQTQPCFRKDLPRYFSLWRNIEIDDVAINLFPASRKSSKSQSVISRFWSWNTHRRVSCAPWHGGLISLANPAGQT